VRVVAPGRLSLLGRGQGSDDLPVVERVYPEPSLPISECRATSLSPAGSACRAKAGDSGGDGFIWRPGSPGPSELFTARLEASSR